MDLGKLSKLSQHRKCVECGAEFETDGEGTAMQKHADHLTIHQPTGEQWTHAYNMIQEARRKEKSVG